MATFTGVAADGSTVTYEDKKRNWWWFGYIGVAVFLGSFWLYFLLGNNPLTTLIPVVYTYVLIPILDKIVGLDTHNPPEEVVAEMSEDNFYRYQVLARIPFAFLIFFTSVWFVATQSLPWWSYLALLVGIASSSGAVLLLTHELGHKPNKLDHWASIIGNGLMGYGHFCIEHNRGHHVEVSTPEDPASAYMGQNVYRFALREIPGAYKRGLAQEKKRLAAKGYGFWNWHNDILRSNAVTLLIMVVCVYFWGPMILLFVIPLSIMSWFMLTLANYVEHYGLLRQKLPNGKYEPCQPKHSWNSNHLVSNVMTFHLQRHSDHHAYPMRPYQVLRNHEDIPNLPNGYSGCFLLALIPPLWYNFMDPKVMEWADGDITKVNVDPKRKQKLYKKYGGQGQVAAE